MCYILDSRKKEKHVGSESGKLRCSFKFLKGCLVKITNNYSLLS